MTRHTVLGASGLIGARLTQLLKEKGEDVFPVGRDAQINYSDELGYVYYCIGVTADYRTRPYETVNAHVHVLQDLLEKARFKALLYLSSTRVYQGANDTTETADLIANPTCAADIYNISKMMGESLCLIHENPSVRVARISNVISDYSVDSSLNFFDSILQSVLTNKHLILQTGLESEKDYIDIDDVVDMLYKINIDGGQRIYNLARGINTTTDELLRLLQDNVGFSMNISSQLPVVKFPIINNSRIVSEFDFAAKAISETVQKRIKNS